MSTFLPLSALGRRALHSAFAGVLALSLLALAACDSSDSNDEPPPPPPATTGTLAGTISLPPGTAGSVGNTRIALYSDQVDYYTDSFVYQVGADGNGGYTISNIVPGTYYMDAWKDNNNNGAIDAGDFYGVWGSLTAGNVNLTPIPIAAGQTQTVSFNITQLAGRPSIKLEVVAE